MDTKFSKLIRRFTLREHYIISRGEREVPNIEDNNKQEV
jgi:hypothetical protein